MRVSNRTYYGLKAIVNLAKQDEVMPITDIAYAEKIPIPFLEKIFQKLKREGLLTSQKGSLGGYLLARKPSQISVAAIFEALDETLESTPCQAETCPNRSSCQTAHFWQKLDASITATLNSITLEDLIHHDTIEQFHK